MGIFDKGVRDFHFSRHIGEMGSVRAGSHQVFASLLHFKMEAVQEEVLGAAARDAHAISLVHRDRFQIDVLAISDRHARNVILGELEGSQGPEGAFVDGLLEGNRHGINAGIFFNLGGGKRIDEKVSALAGSIIEAIQGLEE